MSEHYQILVTGEQGNEFPMYSVGCICGDYECDAYTMHREPTSEEQNAIREAERELAAAQLATAERDALRGFLKLQEGANRLVGEGWHKMRDSRDEARTELSELRARVERAKALHTRCLCAMGEHCQTCDTIGWPCKTFSILEGTDDE